MSGQVALARPETYDVAGSIISWMPEDHPACFSAAPAPVHLSPVRLGAAASTGT